MTTLLAGLRALRDLIYTLAEMETTA